MFHVGIVRTLSADPPNRRRGGAAHEAWCRRRAAILRRYLRPQLCSECRRDGFRPGARCVEDFKRPYQSRGELGGKDFGKIVCATGKQQVL